jgi:hypothetical protein
MQDETIARGNRIWNDEGMLNWARDIIDDILFSLSGEGFDVKAEDLVSR